MHRTGNWSNKDNKHYRGPIDRIYVAQTETWEVEYFIDHYLQLHNLQVNEHNRRRVGEAMESYPARAPVHRDDLMRHVEHALR